MHNVEEEATGWERSDGPRRLRLFRASLEPNELPTTNRSHGRLPLSIGTYRGCFLSSRDRGKIRLLYPCSAYMVRKGFGWVCTILHTRVASSTGVLSYLLPLCTCTGSFMKMHGAVLGFGGYLQPLETLTRLVVFWNRDQLGGLLINRTC